VAGEAQARAGVVSLGPDRIPDRPGSQNLRSLSNKATIRRRASVAACTADGGRQVVAMIADTGSDASAALHRRLGFTDAGRWVDTLLMQRDLTRTATCAPGSPGA
jgi:hypothetical protein